MGGIGNFQSDVLFDTGRNGNNQLITSSLLLTQSFASLSYVEPETMSLIYKIIKKCTLLMTKPRSIGELTMYISLKKNSAVFGIWFFAL